MSIRLGALHKAFVYGLAIALAATGLLWLVPHYMLASKASFGASRHPLEPWALRLHGAAAMGFLIALGSMLPVHVRRAWQIRRNTRTGIAMLVGILLLIVSSYLLYYGSDEELRPWISDVHWALGLVLLPFLFLHDRAGRRHPARHHRQVTDSRKSAEYRQEKPVRRLPVESIE
ncbi:MAG: hypothetical protein U1E63_12655 [Burkholderiales bacterium]